MTYLFIVLFLALLVITNVFIFKNKSLKFKIIFSICLIAGFFLLYLALIVLLWNSAEDPARQRSQDGNTFKSDIKPLRKEDYSFFTSANR